MVFSIFYFIEDTSAPSRGTQLVQMLKATLSFMLVSKNNCSTSNSATFDSNLFHHTQVYRDEENDLFKASAGTNTIYHLQWHSDVSFELQPPGTTIFCILDHVSCSFRLILQSKPSNVARSGRRRYHIPFTSRSIQSSLARVPKKT